MQGTTHLCKETLLEHGAVVSGLRAGIKDYSFRAETGKAPSTEKVTIPKLMKKTGLSRGFFYKNPTVRREVDRAMEQQAGLVDKRRKIIDMDMENKIMLLEQIVAKFQRENEELKKQNEKLERALNKRDLNVLKNL